MKALRLIFLLALVAMPVKALDLITATVAITNAPIGNTNKITVNGSTRTWTNTITASPSTLIQETNSLQYSATNLLTHLGSYPAVAGQYLSQSSASNVTIRGLPGAALTVTIAGGYAVVTYATNTVTPAFVVRVPQTVESATNQTNIASLLVNYIDISTNSLSTNTTTLQNFVTKGASPLQRVIAPVSFNNVSGTNSGLTNGTIIWANLLNVSNVTGRITALTNGYWTNAILGSPTITNGVNYGNAFSSVGDGTGSEQFGSGAHARNDFDTAVGAGAIATNQNSTAVGYTSQGYDGGTAVGNAANALSGSVAVGSGARAVGSSSVALGANTDDNGFNNVVLIGTGASATADDEVRIGTSGASVVIGGALTGATTTNTTLRGTNILNGRLDLTPRSNSGLANGYNSGVILGTNVYIRFSGPSGAYTNVGFAAGQDGTYHVAQFDNPGLSFTLLHDSGLDATAANRIYTGTGALVNSTNNPVMVHLIYDGAVSRWRVVTIR